MADVLVNGEKFNATGSTKNGEVTLGNEAEPKFEMEAEKQADLGDADTIVELKNVDDEVKTRKGK